MHLTLVRADSAENQSEIDTAWHVFCALSQYHSANPDADTSPGYNKQMWYAFEAWAILFEVED